MKITGLQKVTLLDYPGKVACTVFLSGCDFRCPFCHNFELTKSQDKTEIKEEDFLDFLTSRTGILDGVAITGGEPLINPEIIPFIKKIKEAGFSVKLDTNGNHPALLGELLNDQLIDYVAVDIKNSPKLYSKTIGLPVFDTTNIDITLDLLMSSPVEYELRTTVVKGLHTAESLSELAQWIVGTKRYFLQGFVMSDFVPDKTLSAYSNEEMQELLQIVQKYIPRTQLRGIE